jgi:hypothetical protein
MDGMSRSLERHYDLITMYHKPSRETGRCGRESSEGKGSWKGLIVPAERCLQHKRAWEIKKGWHKGSRRDVRGKSTSDPEACRELVDSQLSIAGKGRHLKSQNGGNQLIENSSALCCERAAECGLRDGRI